MDLGNLNVPESRRRARKSPHLICNVFVRLSGLYSLILLQFRETPKPQQDRSLRGNPRDPFSGAFNGAPPFHAPCDQQPAGPALSLNKIYDTCLDLLFWLQVLLNPKILRGDVQQPATRGLRPQPMRRAVVCAAGRHPASAMIGAAIPFRLREFLLMTGRAKADPGRRFGRGGSPVLVRRERSLRRGSAAASSLSLTSKDQLIC